MVLRSPIVPPIGWVEVRNPSSAWVMRSTTHPYNSSCLQCDRSFRLNGGVERAIANRREGRSTTMQKLAALFVAFANIPT